MDIPAFFRSVPINGFLGFRLLDSDSGSSRVALTLDPRHGQEMGVVHGGILATLADTAAVYALIGDLEEGTGMTSVEFKVNFTRPCRVDGDEIVATANVISRGRRIAVCQSEVRQGDRLVAVGTFTYMFLPDKPVPR